MLTDAGPLLLAVQDAQLREDALLAYPAVTSLAEAALDELRRLPGPLVVPVGAGAERLAGAITVIGQGQYPVASWMTPVAGRVVALLATVGVGTTEIVRAATHLRAQGASKVLLLTASSALTPQGDVLDEVHQLAPRASQRRRSA